MTDKKCGNPIWCTKEIQERVRKRAGASHRTMGNEVAAMLDELDKVAALNVPVLQEIKKPAEEEK